MISLTPLKDDKVEEFTRLFEDYYKELGCDDDVKHLVDEYIVPDLIAGLLSVDILTEESVCGFVVYQTDDVINDWNFKEGWGDVREIYVAPQCRGKGYGKFMLYTAEMKLKESGTDKIYCLPSALSEPFFTACGFEKTDEYNAELDCYVYEKTQINVCDCKK